MSFSPPLIFGPIAPENNPPINPQYYIPNVFDISSIGLGSSTTITTSVDHNYVVGQLIRLLIPLTYGSFQLNGLTGYVTSIPAPDQVVINIDSTNANAFVIGATTTPAQIVAVGDINSGVINAEGRINNGTFIPGSFINISPA